MPHHHQNHHFKCHHVAGSTSTRTKSPWINNTTFVRMDVFTVSRWIVCGLELPNKINETVPNQENLSLCSSTNPQQNSLKYGAVLHLTTSMCRYAMTCNKWMFQFFLFNQIFFPVTSSVTLKTEHTDKSLNEHLQHRFTVSPEGWNSLCG